MRLCYICGESCALRENGAGEPDCVWAAMVVIAGYAVRERRPLELCGQDAVQPRFWREALPADYSGRGVRALQAGWAVAVA